jgi:small conductance mechanosensitive channel
VTSLAVTRLHDLEHWARGDLIEIVALIAGAVLLTRLATWFSGRVMKRIEASAATADGLVRSENAKYRQALTQVLTWSCLVIIYCLTAVLVVQRLGIPISGFVAPATVIGVALGFGAQRVVQDILAGFFIVIERQYGFGDVVRLAVTGAPQAMTGTVEDVTLRVTRIRTLDGEVITTPNGQIVQVTNLSRDWARAVIDVPVPITVDLNLVTDLLRRICDEAFRDEQLHRLLLDPPSVMGVESLEVDQVNVRVVARTLPGKQFEVGRALRARITVAFLHEGISLPTAVGTAHPTGAPA